MPPALPEITVQELKTRLDQDDDFLLLDVRQPKEYEVANLNGKLIPLMELPDRIDELAAYKNQDIVVHCHHGRRSAQAARLLQQQGFKAINLRGGIDAWSKEIDDSVPTY